MPKCILDIRDEVNIRFNGLDPSTRRKLKQAVEFFMPHAVYTPAYKIGSWDGKTSYCDVGGRTYLNLLDKLLPIVVAAGYEIELNDERHDHDAALQSIPKIEADSFSHIMWPPGHDQAGKPIVFRDYQIEIINAGLDNLACIQEIATGAGKTLVTAAMSYLCEPYGRSVIIVPNKDLVTQTEKDYINMGLDVGVLYGERKEFDKTHTICTWQSLEVLRKAAKKGSPEARERLQYFGDSVCVIVDEVHKAKADVLKDLLTGVFAHVPVRWGLTGTVPKDDCEAMSILASLGPVVNTLRSKTLQDQGVLAKLDIAVIQLKDAPLGFTNYAQELKWLTTNPTRLDAISDATREAAKVGNTLVLVDRIETGNMLIERNPDWSFVSGATKATVRQEKYDEISTGDFQVVVATYGVAAVGLNIPRIFNVVLFEPGKSFVRVIQSIGRGIRKAKDKDFVNILDITSDLKYSKRHLAKRKAFYRDQEFPYKVVKLDYK